MCFLNRQDLVHRKFQTLSWQKFEMAVVSIGHDMLVIDVIYLNPHASLVDLFLKKKKKKRLQLLYLFFQRLFFDLHCM